MLFLKGCPLCFSVLSLCVCVFTHMYVHVELRRQEWSLFSLSLAWVLEAELRVQGLQDKHFTL